MKKSILKNILLMSLLTGVGGLAIDGFVSSAEASGKAKMKVADYVEEEEDKQSQGSLSVDSKDEASNLAQYFEKTAGFAKEKATYLLSIYEKLPAAFDDKLPMGGKLPAEIKEKFDKGDFSSTRAYNQLCNLDKNSVGSLSFGENMPQTRMDVAFLIAYKLSGNPGTDPSLSGEEVPYIRDAGLANDYNLTDDDIVTLLSKPTHTPSGGGKYSDLIPSFKGSSPTDPTEEESKYSALVATKIKSLPTKDKRVLHEEVLKANKAADAVFYNYNGTTYELTKAARDLKYNVGADKVLRFGINKVNGTGITQLIAKGWLVPYKPAE